MRFTGGGYPNPDQELLLKAALATKETASQCWTKWTGRVPLEEADPASQRLFPLVYRNLSIHGIEHPLLPRLKGIHRYHWCRNRLLFHTAEEVVHLFERERIRTMLLKGAALIPLYYKDYGLRPMQDFDLLVPFAQASQAVDLLRSGGWQPSVSDRQLELSLEFMNGSSFQDAQRHQFDLHWHVFPECCWEAADEGLWEDAIPVDTFVSLAPPHSTQLLHTVVHGNQWNPVSGLRWIPDVLFILRTCPDLNWDEVQTEAVERRLVLHLRESLVYLAEHFGAPVPAGVLRSLERVKTRRGERREYEIKQIPALTRSAAAVASLRFRQLVHTCPPGTVSMAVRRLPRFVQFLTGAETGLGIPRVALQKVYRLARRK